MPPRNAADFLELAENCAFLDRKPISALIETVNGLYLGFSELSPGWTNIIVFQIVVAGMLGRHENR